MEIIIPPLRDRKEDIPELAYWFFKKYTAKFEKEITSISHKAMTLLANYSWPGNVRELENSISRSIIMSLGTILQADALPLEILQPSNGDPLIDLPVMRLDKMEKFLIKKTLKQTDGNRGKAAQLLGIDTSTLWRKMKRWNII